MDKHLVIAKKCLIQLIASVLMPFITYFTIVVEIAHWYSDNRGPTVHLHSAHAFIHCEKEGYKMVFPVAY